MHMYMASVQLHVDVDIDVEGVAQADLNYDSELPYPVLIISELCQIHGVQRTVFMVLLSVLFLCAFLGNVGTLYVNMRRKLRPFFRACLISLACSDLLYCISFTTAYMAHFKSRYLELWTLGSFMCGFAPFVNTATIMFSSLILVAIALDRYMAIKRAASGFWNPSLLFCGLCIGGIWLISVASAGPLFVIYGINKVYLQPTSELVVSELQVASVCTGMRGVVGIYNVILLSLIFLPCVVGFVFLNATIARQLWQRRHHHHQQQERLEESRFVHLLSKPETSYAMMTAFSVAASFDLSTEKLTVMPPPSTPTQLLQEKKLSPSAAARVVRHRRMVRVVLLMMAAFICLRLPAWIFLLLRLYGSFSTPVDWLLYFSFGLLNLTSCALNPLFYTFLTQAMRWLSNFKQKLLNFFCCMQDMESDREMPKETVKQDQHWRFCGSQVNWRCYTRPAPGGCELTQSDQPVAIEEFPGAHDCNMPQFSDLKSDIFTIYSENSLQTKASTSSDCVINHSTPDANYELINRMEQRFGADDAGEVHSS